MYLILHSKGPPPFFFCARDALPSLLFVFCFHLYNFSSPRSFFVSSSHLSLCCLTFWFTFKHFLRHPCLINSNRMPQPIQSSFDMCYHFSSWLVSMSSTKYASVTCTQNKCHKPYQKKMILWYASCTVLISSKVLRNNFFTVRFLYKTCENEY